MRRKHIFLKFPFCVRTGGLGLFFRRRPACPPERLSSKEHENPVMPLEEETISGLAYIPPEEGSANGGAEALPSGDETAGCETNRFSAIKPE